MWTIIRMWSRSISIGIVAPSSSLGAARDRSAPQAIDRLIGTLFEGNSQNELCGFIAAALAANDVRFEGDAEAFSDLPKSFEIDLERSHRKGNPP